MPKYHEWMEDPGLLEATGSEPLSFQEEIDMQKSWRDDPEKCTFIVLNATDDEIQREKTTFSVGKNLGAMVGDVNLFLNEIDDDEEEEDENPKEKDGKRIQAEIDIMIAESKCRKMGLGRAATCSMLLYGARTLKIERFFCKINEDNIASIKLFESLGFVQCDYAACFKQVELELLKPIAELEKDLEPYGTYEIIPCPLDDAK